MAETGFIIGANFIVDGGMTRKNDLYLMGSYVTKVPQKVLSLTGMT
jgi:hypothetical protein